MQFPISTAPHISSSNNVARVMRLVLCALLPAAAVHTWFFGWGLPIHFVIAVATGLLAEALALRIRSQPLRPYLTDGSVLVTAALLVFPLPPLTPWWLVVLGMAFAVLIAKHAYGGLGFNLFNPAMAGYALLLLCFPVDMTHWPAVAGTVASGSLNLAQSIATIMTGALPDRLQWDAITMATPFDALRSGLQSGRTIEEVTAGPAFGSFGGRGWEWVSIVTLGGGVWLMALGVIRWHIPAMMLLSITVLATSLYASNPGANGGILFHLFNGGTMLGAFFIATDPVTAATSNRGRLVYGGGVGVLTFIIRNWGGYPDGVAFAVLLMNLCAPLIDRYTVPRIYGHSHRQPAP